VLTYSVTTGLATATGSAASYRPQRYPLGKTIFNLSQRIFSWTDIGLWHGSRNKAVGLEAATPKGFNFSQIFLSDGLQLMHITYANSINMHPLLCAVFHQEHSFPFPFNIKIGCKVFRQYGETPYINIFDARVASDDHRLIIRAWPTARAASCSKAWLHHLTHRYLVLSRLVYGVFFSLCQRRRPLFLIILSSFRIDPILVKKIRLLRGIKD
jgi:hypothetical protein